MIDGTSTARRNSLEIIPVSNMMSTAFIVVDDNRVMLVDTGAPGRSEAILDKVKSIGFQPTDVKLIVLTHHHFDHSGSANALREATGARIAIHHLDAPELIRGDRVELTPTRTFARLLRKIVVRNSIPATMPDIQLTDDEDLATLGGIGRTHWTPGHTAGSITIQLADGTLIAGDAISGGAIRPGTALGPMFVTDRQAAQRSVEWISQTAKSTVYVAHGGPLTAKSIITIQSL
jgi:glyoxylase-like metal-dependent hydrolase (beta-lactamase superfamily II)